MPSFLLIICFEYANIYNITALNNNIATSIVENPDGVIPPNIAIGKPNTIHILNILLPTILPIAISFSFLIHATTLVTSSGNDVPKATIVSDISLSLTPNFCATRTLLFTTKLLPNTIAIKPNNVIIIDLPSLY